MLKAHTSHGMNGSTIKRGAWKGLRVLFVAALLLAFCAQLLGPTQSAKADVAAGYSEYYVPGFSDNIASILSDLTTNYTGTNGLTNVITMPITTPDLVLYYDHWENGYSTGAAGDETYSGYAVGHVLTFKSTNIPMPTRGTNLNACTGSTNPTGTTTTACYDGRDRIFVVGGAVSISQVFWPTSNGTVFAHAWEIYPVKPWETSYVIPVGEDLYVADATAYADFDCVYVMVEAWYDNTTVTFDNKRTTAPATGACGVNWWQDGSVVINKGETYFRGGVYSDSTVASDQPVEVQMIVGRENSQWDSRSHTLVPTGEWDNVYYSPVPSYGTSQAANAQVNGTQPGNLRLRKTATETGYDQVGDILHYSYAVRNDSYSTTLVGQVTVTDNKTTVTCPNMPDGDLDPRETTTCTGTYTITAADITAGSVVNIATAHIGALNSNTSQLTVYTPSINTPVNIYIYNPTASPLAVTYQDLTGTAVCTIPAYSTMSIRDAACAGRFVAVGSGAKLSAADDFFAIGEYDTDSANYNWGFSIIPASALDNEYFVPWAPGDYNVPPVNNGSPVFVTPTVDAQSFCVDYSPITTPPTCEATFTLNLLQVQKIRDADNDNTGMHVWSDFPFAITWGEDDQYATENNPYIDAGYTIPPPNPRWIDVILDVDKSANPEAIVKQVGEVVTFTVDVNTFFLPLDNIFIEDYLPPYFDYVPGTTVITWPGVGSPYTTDPVKTGAAATGYTLHWGTAPNNIGDMGTNETMTLTFDAITVTGFSADTSVNNTKGTGYLGSIPLSATAQATVIAGLPGYITVIKDAIPNGPQDFAFTLVNQAKPGDPTNFSLDDDADATLLNSRTFGLRAGNYTVSEVTPLPSGWDLTSAVCVSSIIGKTPAPANIALESGETVTCTFTNTQQLADIAVVKDDKWYWDPVQLMFVERWVPRGGIFTYNINVSYPVSELTNQTAVNVVMSDTLDLNISYFEEQDPVVTDPYGLSPVCTEPTPGGGGTFSCTVASMDEGESYTVSFFVQVLETAPMGGLIESGECTQNPNKQGDFDVDVCNLVSVETDTLEYDYTNNDDSEPTDIGKSTAVTLTDFTATGAKKSVILTWTTTSETDNAGFNLYRATSLTGEKVLVNDTLIAPQGDGNPWGVNYEYVDAGLKPNKVYYYWLEDLDFYGVATLHGPVNAKTTTK